MLICLEKSIDRLRWPRLEPTEQKTQMLVVQCR
jgi:hypothetical protein